MQLREASVGPILDELGLSSTNYEAVNLLWHLTQSDSFFKPYLGAPRVAMLVSVLSVTRADVLPRKFETSLFWSDEELEELQGSRLKGF